MSAASGNPLALLQQCISANQAATLRALQVSAEFLNNSVLTAVRLTPLCYACEIGALDCARVMIHEIGANTNTPTPHSNIAPLHCACEKSQEAIVKLLLGIKATDANARTSSDVTPLHCAIKSGSLSIVKMLVERGASVNVVEHKGLTPLYMTALYDHIDIMKYLLSRGADLHISKTKTKGCFPLYAAAERGSVQALAALVSAGANLDEETKGGYVSLLAYV